MTIESLCRMYCSRRRLEWNLFLRIVRPMYSRRCNAVWVRYDRILLSERHGLRHRQCYRIRAEQCHWGNFAMAKRWQRRRLARSLLLFQGSIPPFQWNCEQIINIDFIPGHFRVLIYLLHMISLTLYTSKPDATSLDKTLHVWFFPFSARGYAVSLRMLILLFISHSSSKQESPPSQPSFPFLAQSIICWTLNVWLICWWIAKCASNISITLYA